MPVSATFKTHLCPRLSRTRALILPKGMSLPLIFILKISAFKISPPLGRQYLVGLIYVRKDEQTSDR